MKVNITRAVNILCKPILIKPNAFKNCKDQGCRLTGYNFVLFNNHANKNSTRLDIVIAVTVDILMFEAVSKNNTICNGNKTATKAYKL